MPCTDGGVPYNTHSQDTRAVQDKIKLDILTRLLCEACRIIDENQLHKYSSPELLKWAKAHRETDKERLMRERKEAAKKADAEWLSKLERPERELLEGK